MKILKDSGAKFNGKIQLWLTPDEETHGTYGSIFMTKNHFDIINADATIIGEPSIRKPMSSPIIGLGEKGPHWLKFTFHGVAGHGSWPKLKSNAINKATRFIQEANRKLKIPKRKPPITKFQQFRYLLKRVKYSDVKKILAFTGEKSPLDKDKRDSGILYRTTFSFTEINAGIKTNVIPDTCELSADFRAMPGLTTQELFNAIAKFCSKLNYKIQLPEGYFNPQDQNPKFESEPIDITLSIITIGEGSATDPNTKFGKIVQSSFEAIYETSPMFSFNTGFSDGGNMREAGMKDIFVFGPGGRNAHNANEYADIETLKDVTKWYLLIAYRYLNSQ
jgi:acetylornithine deacetylase/succinyl-diaminopimelate desuccinylase-like protein